MDINSTTITTTSFGSLTELILEAKSQLKIKITQITNTNNIVKNTEWGNDVVKKRKKKKGEHSSPETSGKQNLDAKYIERVKGTGGGKMDELLKIYEKGFANRRDYAGKWTDEDLEKEIHDYFKFTAKYDIKPAKAGLRMWLGLSKSQYWEWENNVNAHPLKSELMAQASSFIELQYIGRVEKYPTGNIFLLKSSHGHQDKQEIELHNKSEVDKGNIEDVISKLNLDK